MSENQPENVINIGLDLLTDSEVDALHPSLFPSARADTVQVLQIDRQIKPIPLKVSAKIKALLTPVVNAIGENVPDDITLTAHIAGAVKILCDHYGWDDIAQAMTGDVGEFGISIVELHEIAVRQTEVSTVTDIYLEPLRRLLNFLRLSTIARLILARTV